MTASTQLQKYLQALQHGYDVLTAATEHAGGLGTRIPQRLENELNIGRFEAQELARAVATDGEAVLSPPYAPLMEHAVAGQSRALAWVQLAYVEALKPQAGESEITDELAAANRAAADAAGALARSWAELWELVQESVEQPRAPLALPMETTLGQASIALRRMEQGDGPLILAFATSLPPHDLLFLRRDITQPDQVEAWLRDAASGISETVLALRGDELVGYAAVVSDGLHWTRHVRELRVVVSPSMRGQKLGRLLIEQAFAIAKQQGARKMVAQMTTDQQSAQDIFASMGFEAEAILRNHVMDRDGSPHDLRVMSLDIDAFQAKLLAAITEPEEAPA